MFTLDQCLEAGRPLIFTVTESDLEVLQYLNNRYKDRRFFVYSTTLMKFVPLEILLATNFEGSNSGTSASRNQSTIEVISEIMMKDFTIETAKFDTYIFLDCSSYISDRQIIRRIKDIVSRYQLDPSFALNLMFMSNTVCVPPDLERFSEVTFFNLPSEDELKGISDNLSEKLGLQDKDKPSLEVVNNLKGLTKFEVEQAYLQCYTIYKEKEGKGRIDLDFIRNYKKNSISKTDLLTLLEPDASFDTIGGLSSLKKWVKKCYGGWTVEGKKFGLPLLKGLLMVGLPGNGKTVLAKSLGNEWGIPVLQFDPSRVFSSRVGDSEQNMRRVLKIVESVSPCVLFIDEMEKSMAGMQSSTFSDSGVTARVIASFLTWMQESKAPVFTVATCNSIGYVPPELISRFDQVFFVNLPQTKERKEIFSIHIKKYGRDPDKINLDLLSSSSRDFSGREIEQSIKEALYDCFYNKLEFNTDSILSVLSRKTSLYLTMREQMKALIKWVGWDPSKKDGIRARYASMPDDEDIGRIQNEIDALIEDVQNGGSNS